MVPTLPYNLDLKSRPFQWAVLKDPRKNKVLIIPRRHGKTALAINKIIHDAHWPGNEGKIYYYVCPTKVQAKEVIWKAPNMLAQYLPEELVEKRNEQELTIYLKNKSQIRLKGADDPDSLRGADPYGIIIDEYAQIKPEVYSEVFFPILIANNGWIWLIGTPKGRNDLFIKYSYALDNPETWQAVHMKASTAGVIPKAALDEARKEMRETAFMQEFECEFLEGYGTIFRRVRENVAGKLEEPKRSRQYKMGVDLARHTDWTVLTVVDRHTHHLVHYERFNQIDWQLQKARIEATARRYNNCPITIDIAGTGESIAEDLRRTGLIVNDFRFTIASKKDLIENLAIKIEQNKLTYPEIPELIKELEDFSFTVSAHGNIQYSAPEGLHDDIVCSLALAYWQIGEKLPLSIEPSNYGMDFNIRNPKGYKKIIFQKN